MPRGQHLSFHERWAIFSNMRAGNDAKYIYRVVFYSNSLRISLDHLRHLCSKLKQDAFADVYLLGPAPRTGRPEITDDLAQYTAFAVVIGIRHDSLVNMRLVFSRQHYGANDAVRPSLTTFQRIIKKAKLSRKVMERRHSRRKVST